MPFKYNFTEVYPHSNTFISTPVEANVVYYTFENVGYYDYFDL